VARVGRGDDDEALDPGVARSRDHPVDEPAPEQRVQVLRRRAAHARAEAAGHHDCCELVRHVGQEKMAGAPGFEPGITGPKPVALPLGHAPGRRQFYRRSRKRKINPPTANATRARISAHFTIQASRTSTSASSCDAAKIHSSWRTSEWRLWRPLVQASVPMIASTITVHFVTSCESATI